MEQENLANLNKILAAMSEDHLGKKDFTEALSSVVDKILETEKRRTEEMRALSQAVKTALARLKGDHSTSLSEIQAEVKNQLGVFLQKHEAKMAEADAKMAAMKDGKDADNQMIETNVLTSLKEQIHIPTIEELINDLPKLSIQIRDALELLTEDDRLEIKAIKNLQEELDKLRKEVMNKTIPILGAQTGFNSGALDMHIIDSEIPTGIKNGVNTDFVLNLPPSPVSSLKVYRGGARQLITEDYTFSGQTITFRSAPVANEVITCDYRI